jgi:uncharacterized protein YidB (DUF937 family)
MGFLDAIEGLAKEQAGGTNVKVAGGLLEALEQNPGGLGGVLSSFQNNGMGGEVQQWATQGEQAQATPDQVQQGLNGTGLIDRVAEKAGVSPEVAKVALATILPIVLAHMTRGGQQAPPNSGFGSMLPEILGKLL